jgi:sugar lactone lactonase YvrE
LKLDRRSDQLFVAGGPGGAGYVYDGTTGAELATFQFADPSAPTFVNDVIVTREAAYFTDSRRPVLYVVPLGPGGRLADSPEFIELPLSGDYFMVAGFNANGIAATPNGKWLIIVQSATGLLYRVDPDTGVANVIDLGGALVSAGDGILLDGRTLYVSRNAVNRIAVIDLEPDLSAGEYIGDITSPDFNTQTTIAEFGSSLYAVNDRFGTPIPGTQYHIVRVSK